MPNEIFGERKWPRALNWAQLLGSVVGCECGLFEFEFVDRNDAICGRSRWKMTVEVVSRGHKNLKMKCVETRHSCG